MSSFFFEQDRSMSAHPSFEGIECIADSLSDCWLTRIPDPGGVFQVLGLTLAFHSPLPPLSNST